jgi:hypothetical protein
VQIVDILRHHGGNLASPVEARQRPVAAARFCAAELLLHGESPPPAFVPHLLARQELAEFDRPHLGPEAAGRPEVRDAALRRDAGTGKGHDHPGIGNQAAQALYGGREIGRGGHRVASRTMLRSGMSQFKQA